MGLPNLEIWAFELRGSDLWGDGLKTLESLGFSLGPETNWMTAFLPFRTAAFGPSRHMHAFKHTSKVVTPIAVQTQAEHE